MKNMDSKRNKVSYYVGWGVAWGTVAGAILGLGFCDYYAIMFFLGIACGAGIGGAYGKKKLNK